MITEEKLRELYEYRLENILIPLATKLDVHIKDRVNKYPRVDRVSARAKSLSRFIDKANKTEDGKLKYDDPLNQIQDQIGVRIVTFYLSDIEPLDKIIHDYYAPIEERIYIPDTVNEFGYEGKHYILFIPKDLITPDLPKEHCPAFFELQLKTLFEHAWAEANHDLAYKPQTDLTHDHRRKIAFTAAQAWGADLIFNQLTEELKIVQSDSA